MAPCQPCRDEPGAPYQPIPKQEHPTGRRLHPASPLHPCCIPAASPARLGGSIPQRGWSSAGFLGKETPWLWDPGCVWILLLLPEFVLQTTARKQESPLPGHLPGLLLFLTEIPVRLPDPTASSRGTHRMLRLQSTPGDRLVPEWFGAAEGQDGTVGPGGWVRRDARCQPKWALPRRDHHGASPAPAPALSPLTAGKPPSAAAQTTGHWPSIPLAHRGQRVPVGLRPAWLGAGWEELGE